MTKINVLDKGFVRIHNYMGSDLEIVRAARCSYAAEWRAGENEENDNRLIHYLIRNRHTSPLEVCEFQFEVKAPIFVMRQWSRHRSWSYFTINEVSARYKELPDEFYIPELDKIGTQSKNNKQGREITGEVSQQLIDCLEAYRVQCVLSFDTYHHLLKEGWPREIARCVLPLSTYTHLFVKVDLNNLFHFLDLRTDKHAQFEIREYAYAILQLIEPIVPVAVNAWREFQQ
jgi:thymidylate synthase (FAD)